MIKFRKLRWVVHVVLLYLEPWGQRTKKFQTSVAVPPAPVWVPSQRPLAPSVTSVTSVANDKVIMKLSRLCTGLLAFALQLRKTSARRPSDEAVRQVSPQMGSHTFNEVGRTAQYVRKGEGRKGGNDGIGIITTEFQSPSVL